MTTLEQAAVMAQDERSQSKTGRVRYSAQLKDLLRQAVQENSKLALSKKTKISYPTILKIVGTSRSASKAKRASRAQAKSNVSIEIAVQLPSDTRLRYTSLKALQADAKALSRAAKQVS